MLEFRNIYHVSQVLERINGAEKKNECISTSNEQMDELLGGGLYLGELVTFVGHSVALGDWLLVQIAKTISKEQNIPTVIVSLDANKEKIVHGILRMRKFGDDTFNFDVTETDLLKMPLYINDHHNMSIDELLSFIRMMAEEKNVKVFVITSIHRIVEYEPDKTIIGRELKALCDELEITILVRTLPNHLFWEKDFGYNVPVQYRYMTLTCGLDEYSDCLIGIERPEVYRILEDEKGNDLRHLLLLETIKNTQIVRTPLCERLSLKLFTPLSETDIERQKTCNFCDDNLPF